MKLMILGIFAGGAVVLALQTAPDQTPTGTIKVRGCLLGNGSNENPWSLRGVVPPPPSGAAPAGAPGARGDGGGRGAGGSGRGDAGGAGAPPADGARGGAQPNPPAPSPLPQPPMDLRLTGVDMSPWRNMFIEVEGTLGPRPGSGLREFQVTSARSAYGDCR